MNEPRFPAQVEAAFKLWKEHNRFRRSDDTPPDLFWDGLNKFYWFNHNGVFYAIELDGYLHT